MKKLNITGIPTGSWVHRLLDQGSRALLLGIALGGDWLEFAFGELSGG
jgi:hypothetical protein